MDETDPTAGEVPPVRLPLVCVAADDLARAAQRRHHRSAAARLMLGIAAAGLATAATAIVVRDVELLQLGAAAAFLAALIIELSALVRRHDDMWFEARTISETVKTAAWRLAVGASPYGVDDPSAPEHVTTQLIDHHAALASLGQHVVDHNIDSLLQLRSSKLAVRRQAYVAYRVTDQQQWFEHRVRIANARVTRLKVAMVIGEVVGLLLALFKAFHIIHVDLSGIAATFISAGAAWLATRQYELNARSYSRTHRHLVEVTAGLWEINDESSWAAAAGAAEDLLMGENQAWHTARSDRAKTLRTAPNGATS